MEKGGVLGSGKGEKEGRDLSVSPVPSHLYPPCPFPCSLCSYCFWTISLREGRKAPERVFILWGWLVGPVSLRLEWASHEVSVGRVRLLLEEVFSFGFFEFYGFSQLFFACVCLERRCYILVWISFLISGRGKIITQLDSFEDTAR